MESVIEQYKVYKEYAKRINLCTLGILVCILLVLLLQEGMGYKNIKKAFIIHIGLIIADLICEYMSWVLLFNSKYLVLYKIVTMCAHLLIWLLPASMFYLDTCIIENRVKFNKKFLNIYLSLFAVLGALIFIPPFRDLIIKYKDISAYLIGPFNKGYFMIEIVLVAFGLGMGLVNCKKIGIRDTIIVCIYSAIPIVMAYLDVWWSSTICLLFMAFSLIILYGITYQKRLILARKQEAEKQIELSNTKNKLLLTQIQPHFLYNTLTTLKYLCEVNPQEAEDLCDNFSNYLRSNIDAVDDDGLVPFEKEVANITNYLKIEQARFGERVKYNYDFKTLDFLVPVLSIQTIVENAVKRGICKKRKGGLITITAEEKEDSFEVVVLDDGVGFDVESVISDGKNHVGIENTKKRLDMCGGSMVIESQIGVGTKVTISIPKEDR